MLTFSSIGELNVVPFCVILTAPVNDEIAPSRLSRLSGLQQLQQLKANMKLFDLIKRSIDIPKDGNWFLHAVLDPLVYNLNFQCCIVLHTAMIMDKILWSWTPLDPHIINKILMHIYIYIFIFMIIYLFFIPNFSDYLIGFHS